MQRNSSRTWHDKNGILCVCVNTSHSSIKPLTNYKLQSRWPKTKIPAVANVVRIDASREVLCSHPTLACFGENATHCKRAPTKPVIEYQHWNWQLHTPPTVVQHSVEVLQQSRRQNSGTAVTQRTNYESFPKTSTCPNDLPHRKIHQSGLGYKSSTDTNTESVT